MSKLGLAYLAVNRSVLEMMIQKSFPIGSLPGPKLSMDGGDAPAETHGFQFATDIAVLVSASDADDAFLRIDLDDVLDIVDTVGSDVLAATEFSVAPGHDRFAFGVDPFQMNLADFTASLDGFEFVPMTELNFAEQVALEEEALEQAEEASLALASDPFETTSVESDDVVTFDEVPSEDTLISGLDGEKVATPAKKAYDRPYLPRGAYFADLRAKGLLQPRKSSEQAVAVIKAKAPGAEARSPRRVRSPEELRNIRRFYATRGSKKSVA